MTETSEIAALTIPGAAVWVGAGKMGGAILAGALARGLDPACVRIQDPSPPAEIADLLSRHGLAAEEKVALGEDTARVLLLAVKPQVMADVIANVRHLVGEGTLVVSIAAGKPLSFFEALLPGGTAVVRAMPNTPAAIGKGITVCCANAHVDATQRAICDGLLSAVGDVGWIDDEAQMDAVTAVSGSGPSYVFHLVECLAQAGVKAGLDEAMAMRLARATVAGSGALLDASADIEAGTLRKNVTSRGGTTAAALEVLMRDEDGLAQLMARAVEAARKRGGELAG